MSDRRQPASYDAARRAIAELERLGLPATGAAVAVLAAHLDGRTPALSLALGPLMAEPSQLTDAVLNALHTEHLQADLSPALALSEALASELRRLSAAVQAAGGGAGGYAHVLDGAVSALAEPMRETALRSLVVNLASATEQMRSRTQVLERQLDETSGAVLALREDLSRARAEALTDALTGLANRKRLDEFLDDALREGAQAGLPVSLILCDIDRFKSVNDQWGHKVGDHVIRFVARVLQENAGRTHLVARYGGEEMAIVAPGLDAADAAEIAERARAAIAGKLLSRRVSVGGVASTEHLGRVTASFGVAVRLEGEGALALVERADAALYASKRNGRNRVTCAPSAAEAA